MADVLERAGTSDHPILVEAAEGIVRLKAGETVLAETVKAVVLREANYPPVYYLPKDSVPDGALVQVEKTTHCPYKGDATYWSYTLPDGQVCEASVWSYETPIEGMSSITGYLGFYTKALEASFDPPAA